VRALTVNYPVEAARVQGFVVIEFTVAADGRASDIQVIESSPGTVFNKAAREAVARGRFDTSVFGDDAQTRRARLRISFKPG
jgi:protein TonB